jgi:hypothetical protein
MTSSPAISKELGELRGEPARRPARDERRAAGLRAELEDGLFAVLGAREPETPLIVRSATLAGPDLSDATSARLRGQLVAVLARLRAAGLEPVDPFADALVAWRAEAASSARADECAALDPEGRARLRAEVVAHDRVLARALEGLPARWPVRTGSRASVRLGGGWLVLRDRVDLVIGAGGGPRAQSVLVDVTTAPPGPASERALRYHALVETLRASSAPLASATLSTATGELVRREVDDELLAGAVADVLARVHATWGSR